MSLNETVKTPSGVFNDCIMIKGEGQTNFIGDSEIGSIGIKITSEEWYSKRVGLIKMIREEETDTDLFGTTRMIQLLENYKSAKAVSKVKPLRRDLFCRQVPNVSSEINTLCQHE